MKKIFYIILAVVAFSSCTSKDDGTFTEVKGTPPVYQFCFACQTIKSVTTMLPDSSIIDTIKRVGLSDTTLKTNNRVILDTVNIDFCGWTSYQASQYATNNSSTTSWADKGYSVTTVVKTACTRKP